MRKKNKRQSDVFSTKVGHDLVRMLRGLAIFGAAARGANEAGHIGQADQLREKFYDVVENLIDAGLYFIAAEIKVNTGQLVDPTDLYAALKHAGKVYESGPINLDFYDGGNHE